MKSLLFCAAIIVFALNASGQNEKAARPSPAAKVIESTKNGLVITIAYSQPAVKGRTIGKDLEPLPGQVWRTGANEATIFEISKDGKIEGKPLPAGKYGLFTIANGDDWTIIFNKTWNQWGAFTYKESDDALRVNVKAHKAPKFSERMTFTVSKEGNVSLFWGDSEVDFKVE